MTNEIGLLLQSYGPQVSFFGLVVAGFWLVFSGKLVPRGTLDLNTQQWEARLRERATEAESWKAVAEKEAAARAGIQASLQDVLEEQKTIVRLMQATLGAPTHPGSGGQT